MAGVNRVEFGNDLIIDLTGDTVTKNGLMTGMTAHDAKGDPIVGVGGSIGNIDDTAGEGDIAALWSADKIAKELREKVELDSNSVFWTVGVLTAKNEINGNSKYAVTSPLMHNVDCIKIKSGVRAVVGFFRNGQYIGKINQDDDLDQIGSSWKWFTTIIDVKHYLERFNADGVRVSIASIDTSIIISDANYFGNENSEIHITDLGLDPSCSFEPFFNWQIGTINADGSINSNNKYAVYSTLLKDVAFCKLRADVKATIYLYNENGYIGKISANDSLNKNNADYHFFNGWVNVQYYCEKYNADAIKICVLSNELSLVISDPKNYGNEICEIYRKNYCDLFTKEIINEWNIGTISGNGTIAPNNHYAVYSPIVYNPFAVKILDNNSINAVLFLYNNQKYIGKIDHEFNVNKNIGYWCYFYGGTLYLTDILKKYNANAIRLCIMNLDTSKTISDPNIFGNEKCFIYRNDFIKDDTFFSNCYVIDNSLQKKNIGYKELGLLTYNQSFCKYNNKYYSIDGNNISEQDLNFNQLRNVVLNTAHGNSLQLGSNGVAYASGWNNNKIYIVDLENLSISNTIALPTTGYTTGVVDETRNYVYIFQRDSYPDHEDYYNFIVYDLTNENIISTKKILSFGAMQACDFYNDRIIVLNGLGSNTCPNGYRIFDTNGNIISEYHLNDFSNVEPEGVVFDRNEHELLISFVDKKLYKFYLI